MPAVIDGIGLRGMAVPRGQQCDLSGLPALVEQRFHGVVGCLHHLVERHVDDPDRPTARPAGPDHLVGERAEDLSDLFRGAQVLVQSHGRLVDRYGAVAGEHPLRVVHEDEQPPAFRVAQALQQGWPP
jgi:hypothetical protein